MRTSALYRALLRFYPAAFRNEYGEEMLLAFSEQLGEARRKGALSQLSALWMRATLDALTIAPKEHWHVIRQDLRYAFRTMAARPGFTAVAVISLALGIGANTAIFSLWNGVVRVSLPGVHKPKELVMLTNPNDSGMWTGRWEGRTDGPRSWLSYPEFEQMRDYGEPFSALMAAQSGYATWPVRYDGGAWEEVRGRLVSGGFFEVLGVKPAIGQLFTTLEDRSDTPHAVISYSYWQRRFGGRFEVLGKTVSLQKTTMTIIGVTPRGFIGETSGQQPDIWFPIRMQPRVYPGDDWLHDRPPEKVMWLHVFGRLKPGVSLAQAEAQSNALFQAGLESFYPSSVTGNRRSEFLDQRLKITPAAGGASRARPAFSDSLGVLLAAVGVLLLIACANLANLLLARGAARRSEIAVRLLLGASRARLMRQLVTESLALAALGGVAALAVAYFVHGALVRMLAETDSRFQMTFALDLTVLVFVLVTIIGTTVLFGVFPAWQVSRANAGASLKEQNRSTTGSLRQMRSGRALVSLQLALSLPLLVGAGLLVRTVYNLQHADLGFPADHLLLVRPDLREAASEPARRTALIATLREKLAAIPGVRSASFSNLGLFSGGESWSSLDVEGYTPKGDRDRGAGFDVVGPLYFSTLGVPLLLGREIIESDRGGNACVVNEAFTKRFFENRDPINRQIALLSDKDRTTYQIVGVVKNIQTQELRGSIAPRFYIASRSRPNASRSPTFLIRTHSDPAPVMNAARKTLQDVDANVPIITAASIEDQMRQLTAQDRTTARLAVVFGLVALALAGIGLYGVLSYGIARRSGEIAIRMALGARPGRVISMILMETTAVVAAGLALGGALAYYGSRLVNSRLYNVDPQDPLTIGLAIALLLVVALSAAYLPARRASRLDPMVALRQH
jgi:predicted permease